MIFGPEPRRVQRLGTQLYRRLVESAHRVFVGGLEREDADGNRPFELGAAKTAASERTIAVSREVLDKLDLSGALVFTNDAGGAINADSFRKNVWHPAMVKSGLPKHRRPGLHDLRHTHASRLIDAGIPIVAVSKRLGHSNVSITLSTYAHVASDADERILAALA